MGEGLFVIGGSSSCTPLLLRAIADLGVADKLHTITLFGRNRARLEFVARLGTDFIRAIGTSTRVDTTTDFAACLDERYGILLNQIRIGGMAARDRNEKVALPVGLPAHEAG